MRAVILTGHGGLEKLEYREDWKKPVVGKKEVLVRTLACGLNNTDVNTRTAWYSKNVTGATTGESLVDAENKDATWGGKPIHFPRIQGADACGIVEEIGEGADEKLLGHRVLVEIWIRDWKDTLNFEKAGVFGSECDGGFAEYFKVDYRQVYPIDSNFSDAELATFPTAYNTAENMLNRAQVKKEDIILITGASGGVGSALIQLARRRGATTVALCSEEKTKAIQEIGANIVLPRNPKNLCQLLEKKMGKKKVSVVADVVGGNLWQQLIEALEKGGRYVCSGAIAGPIVELDLRSLYLRDLTFLGATVPPPKTFADLISYIEKEEIKPLLAKTYPLEKLREAQSEFIAKKHIGNIVVLP